MSAWVIYDPAPDPLAAAAVDAYIAYTAAVFEDPFVMWWDLLCFAPIQTRATKQH
jgi:hypothetical protein